MKAKLIQAQDEKTFAVVFDKGDACIAGLLDFAKQHNLNAAHFTAIGAFSDVTLGFFDRQRMDYQKISLDEQVEVLSLVGGISRSTAIHPRSMHTSCSASPMALPTGAIFYKRMSGRRWR